MFFHEKFCVVTFYLIAFYERRWSAPRIFIGQGRFSEVRAQFLFFQINALRARVVILDVRGL